MAVGKAYNDSEGGYGQRFICIYLLVKRQQ